MSRCDFISREFDRGSFLAYAHDLMRVSVVGTIHEPLGRVTADALFSLLRHLQPDTIFLEMPRSAFDDFIGGAMSSLEAIAVRRFRSESDVALVPVDLPTPEQEFFTGWDEVRRKVRSKSVEYCRLKSSEEQYVSQLGFEYLNSSHFGDLTTDIHEATMAALAQFDDPQLSAHYEAFVLTNECRERNMVEIVETYCASHRVEIGALLVGASHRRSLHEKASARAVSASYPVTWDFLGSV
jgi:hypothetical protein